MDQIKIVVIAKWPLRLSLTLPSPSPSLGENLQDTAMSAMNRVLPVLTLCRMWCRKFAPTLAECYSGLSARLQGSDVQSASSGRTKVGRKEFGANASLEGTECNSGRGQKVENLLSGGDQSCMQVSAQGRHS